MLSTPEAAKKFPDESAKTKYSQGEGGQWC
jgi:hypothetical protein